MRNENARGLASRASRAVVLRGVAYFIISVTVGLIASAQIW
jgi:hypothetical protein